MQRTSSAVAVVVSNEDSVVSEVIEGLSVEDSGASVNDEAVSVV